MANYQEAQSGPEVASLSQLFQIQKQKTILATFQF